LFHTSAIFPFTFPGDSNSLLVAVPSQSTALWTKKSARGAIIVDIVRRMETLTSYIIASVQRSGTHLLCSLLRNTGVAGSPDEHFLSKPGETWEGRWHSPSRMAYVEGVLRQNTSLNGVFGTVVMWSYFERALQKLQEIPAYNDLKAAELLAAVLHQPRYIWLRRRNRIEQAVSWEIACQTGVWARKPGEKPRLRGVPKFDFKVVDEWCKRIAEHEAGWASYFRENQIEPLVLFYEDMVVSARDTAERVLEFLGLQFPPAMAFAPPAIEKQATHISEEWIASYLKLKRKKTSKLARIVREFRI
jgi:LPS sulfotransferase NodH